jgi:hypothetical protein
VVVPVNVPSALAVHDALIAPVVMGPSSPSTPALRLATDALVLFTLLTVAVSALALRIPVKVADTAGVVPTVVWSGVLATLTRPEAPSPKASGLVVG